MIEIIQAPLFINKIEKHEEHKIELLRLIEQSPQGAFRSISTTDWDLDRDGNDGYLSYFHNSVIRDTMCSIQKVLNSSSWDIRTAWFQQYEENSTHNWHSHSGCNFTNCYFLELPDSEYKTEIRDPITGKSIEYEAKEGDVITFPAYMAHRSNINGKGRKTVISFNSDFRY